MSKPFQTLLTTFVMGIILATLIIATYYAASKIIITDCQQSLREMKEVLEEYTTTTQRIYAEYLSKNEYCMQECQGEISGYDEDCLTKCHKDLEK